MKFIIYVPYVIGLWKVFEKTGQKGWKAVIPFYNYYLIVKIAKRPLFYFWWTVLPIAVCFSLVTIWAITRFLHTQGGQTVVDTNSFLLNVLPLLLSISIIFMLPSFILSIIIKFDIAKAFGKKSWFGLGLVVLPFIFYPILGFDESKYEPSHLADHR